MDETFQKKEAMNITYNKTGLKTSQVKSTKL